MRNGLGSQKRPEAVAKTRQPSALQRPIRILRRAVRARRSALLIRARAADLRLPRDFRVSVPPRRDLRRGRAVDLLVALWHRALLDRGSTLQTVKSRTALAAAPATLTGPWARGTFRALDLASILTSPAPVLMQSALRRSNGQVERDL